MALKRLMRWAIWESNRFKYLALRRSISFGFRLNSNTRCEMIDLKPRTAYLRKDTDNTHFDISIFVEYPPLGLTKIIHLRRLTNSPLLLLLKRINSKIYTRLELIQKRKKKSGTLHIEVPQVNALLYLDEKQLSDEMECSQIFELDGKLVFEILNDFYAVHCNIPWVNCLCLPKNVKTNMVIHPLKFEAIFTDPEKSSFTWFKSTKSGNEIKSCPEHIKDWEEIGRGYFYRTTEEDAAHFIKLECIPKNEKDTGPKFTEFITAPVEHGECNYYYKNTHELTREPTDEDRIRIVTYNILAFMYTCTKEAKAMFDYCPNFAIEKCQRFSAISCELVGYNADLLCLQEIEVDNFQSYLMPQLRELGYIGLICLKSQDREGTACIVNGNKFNILGSQNYIFSQEITTNEFLSNILLYIKQNEEFYQKFISLPHCLQLVALKSKVRENEAIVVGNVHLYSSPEADLIRLLQVLSSFGLFQSFLKQLNSILLDEHTTLMICGDFNSTPDSSIHELIMNGSLSSDHSIWKSNEMKDSKGLSFHLPVKMGNAYGTPEFTNYTRCFKGCLDYIYYQIDRLEVDKRYPLASEVELSENVGLPSVSFPSDHLPLIVDMKWKC